MGAVLPFPPSNYSIDRDLLCTTPEGHVTRPITSVRNRTVEQTSVLVVSCDAYADLWPIFFGLFEKYWPDCPYKIYLGSNHATYSSDRVQTICIGDDRSYSDNLRLMLAEVETEHVILMVEDYFFCARVDGDHFQSFVSEFAESGAKSLKLISTYPRGRSPHRGARIGPVPPATRYRVGIGASIWKVEWLRTHLPLGRSAWELEKHGLLADQLPAGDVLALDASYSGPLPFSYRHGVIKGRWLPTSVPFLLREGFGRQLRLRRILSFSSTLRVGLFLLLMRAFTAIGYSWKPPATHP